MRGVSAWGSHEMHPKCIVKADDLSMNFVLAAAAAAAAAAGETQGGGRKELIAVRSLCFDRRPCVSCASCAVCCSMKIVMNRESE